MGSPFCSASIVDSRHLVTTASCVFEMAPSSLNVQYGTEDKNNVRFADIVKKVHIHPMYSFYAKVRFSITASSMDHGGPLLRLTGDLSSFLYIYILQNSCLGFEKLRYRHLGTF